MFFCAGAIDEVGNMPYYAEHCAAMLAVTYSSGQGMQRNIVCTCKTINTGYYMYSEKTDLTQVYKGHIRLFMVLLFASNLLFLHDKGNHFGM